MLRSKNTNEIQRQRKRKEDGKTPRHEEKVKHWTSTGCVPMDYSQKIEISTEPKSKAAILS